MWGQGWNLSSGHFSGEEKAFSSLKARDIQASKVFSRVISQPKILSVCDCKVNLCRII